MDFFQGEALIFINSSRIYPYSSVVEPHSTRVEPYSSAIDRGKIHILWKSSGVKAFFLSSGVRGKGTM